MNPGGVLLIIGGVWVLCQVLGGDALVRLGLVDVPATATPQFPAVPDRGYADVPHNAQGYPL